MHYPCKHIQKDSWLGKKSFTGCPKRFCVMRSNCSYFFHYCYEFTSAVKHLPYCWRCQRSQAGCLNLHTDIPASREVNSVKCSFIWPVLKWKDVTWWGLHSLLKLPVHFRRRCCEVSVQAADTCSTASLHWLLLNPQSNRETSPGFPVVARLCVCWFLKFHSQLIFSVWALGRRINNQSEPHICYLLGFFGGEVSSALLLLESNKKIVRKLSLCAVIMEFP